jgi:hypothetical protein
MSSRSPFEQLIYEFFWIFAEKYKKKCLKAPKFKKATQFKMAAKI